MEAPVEVEAVSTASQTVDAISAADSEDSTAIAVERVVESEVVKSESDKQAEDAATAKELTSAATAGESQAQGPPGSPGGPGIGGGALVPELQAEVVEQALAPSPRPAPVVPEPVVESAAIETASVESDPDGGLSLPLRELELAASALMAALALVTLWMVRRSRQAI
ncbi:MAG: hypothetical protein QF898_08810 [SAR202 cluster bacterium]|jgi:hypothetical protein|nr:hypothetical protein [SAR202 cluster bacterium]MDP6713833.1 hypothetical protein [SAR202 cluster bacterium]